MNAITASHMTSMSTLGKMAVMLRIVLLELFAAAWLLGFLKSDDWRILMALLALPTALFLWAQRQPAVERHLSELMAVAPRTVLITMVILVAVLPFFVGSDSYILHLLIMGQLYAVLALALNFQLGSANIPNFATGASYGIGAYVSALLAIHFGVSFWWGLLASAAVATAFGFLLGIPCMRTRESYLALVTIAFGVVIHQLITNFEWTGGANGLVGIPAPVLFGHSFADTLTIFGQTLPSQANFYYLASLLVVLAIVVSKRLHNSRVGLAWNALRTDELAAKCMGINVTGYKVLAFAVDAFLSAFAGTIYAFYVSYISPDNFTFLVSVTIMTMVIVGGLDSTFGVIVGALLLTILPEKFRAFSDYRLLMYGVIVITMLIVRPQGLFPQRLRKHGGQ